MRKWLLGMEDELVMVEETEKGYRASAYLQGAQPVQIASDPQNKQRLYCGTYGHGLWKSEDGGYHWKAVGKVNSYHGPNQGNGISSACITGVMVHPIKTSSNGNSIVYAGTEPSALYFSEDLGQTWIPFNGIKHLPSRPNWQFPPRPHTSHVRWIAPSYANENQLNVSIEFGAFIRSSDHGKHWQDRPFLSPLDTHTLLAHPNAPGRLYAACGDGLRNPELAYAQSEDEGRSWAFMSEGLENHPYLYSMALHPEDADYRLVSASESAAKAHHDSLYATIYRKKGNEDWKETAAGLPCDGSFIHTLTADPAQPGIFYALNNQGLFRLDADQERWEKMNIPWPHKYLQQHPSCLMVVGQ
ncbi:WD40/YVTN/BNR-like repeat-containing protein [Virgibacillus halophilus]|uniref:Sialidase family protein n=1 Tax=Tigheibacillus halophilus TaxID=361280 RepID=A0ABU5C6Z0_9BACI|nr:sialidase family protein [Virgibacillus halophilus]